MGLNAALDEAIRAVDTPAHMPEKLWELVTDDWKLKFTAHASPYVPSGADLYAFGTGAEVADVKGVYIPFNLLDLVTDPKKTLSKFVERSLNPLNPFGSNILEGEFWTDLDTSVEREMWRDLIGDVSPTGKPFLGTLKTTVGPLNFTGQGVLGAGKMFSSATGRAETVEGAVDVYEQAGFGVLNFVAKKKSALSRNEAYSDMQRGFISAAATEFANKRATISGITAGGPLDLELGTRIDGLISESSLVGDLSGLGSALSDVQKQITTAGFTGTVTVGQVQGKMAGLTSAVTQAQLHIADARRVYAAVPQELARFNHSVAGLESYLRDLGGFSGALAGRSSTDVLGKLGEGEAILSRAASLSGRFSNTRYGGGVADQYIQSVGRRAFEGTKSLLNSSFVDPATGLDVMSDGYKSLQTVYDFQKRVYLQEDGRDLLKQISKGELGKNYLWIAQLRDRVQVFTPAYWTGKVMERTRFFGLVYNEKIPALNPLFDKSPLIRDHYFTERFSVNYGGSVYQFSSRFKGSKHLGSFYGAWTKANATTGNRLIGTRDATTGVMTWGSADDNLDGFFALLNGNHAGLQAWVGEKDWLNLTTKFTAFKTDLQKAGIWSQLELDAAGNVVNSAKNRAILGGLFRKIGIRKANAANLDPFLEKFGALQIYTSKLSLIQQELFTRLKLNRLAAPLVRAKTIVAQKIANTLSRLVLKTGVAAAITALGVATGGLAEVIAPFIEKILQALVSKVIDGAKDLLKAVLKGDIVGEFNKMMDDAAKATEKVITCGCIVPVFLAAAAFMMMANFLGSVSPVDRAKSAVTAAVSTLVPPRPEPVEGTSCVFPTYIVQLRSYAGGNVPGRHGSNDYWAPRDAGGSILGRRDCGLNIPYFAGSPAVGPVGDPTSWCSGQSNLRPYYGYALDVTAPDPDTTWVYAPELSTVPRWDLARVKRIATDDTGCFVVLNGRDDSHNYSVFLLHLACLSLPTIFTASVEPGDPVAKLFDYRGGKHAHIEMQVDGAYVKPEDWLCL
jgi:hypothetical protein